MAARTRLITRNERSFNLKTELNTVRKKNYYGNKY